MKPPLNLTAVLFAAAAIFLNACAAVVSTAPFGAKPAVLDAVEWSGSWATADGTMKIDAIEPDDGVLQISWIENEDDKPVLKTTPVYVRAGGEWTYASYRDPDNAEEDADAPFYWGRLKKEKGLIIAWAPDASKFADLVTAGKLPGTVDEKGQNTVLQKLKPAHFELIESESEGVLFLWDEPIILRRITDHD